MFQTGQPTNYPVGQYELRGLNVPIFGLRNQERLPAYHRLDISATLIPQKNKGRKFQSEWSFGIYNLYNRRNAASINFRQNSDTGNNEALRTSILGSYPLSPITLNSSQMKLSNNILLFALIMSLFSCEDVIDVVVQNSTPRLVIDAQFNVFTKEESPRLEGGVRLSFSANYFDQEVTMVKDATVVITHLNSGREYPLFYSDSEGLFLPETIDFLTDVKSDYEIKVVHSGQTYIGTTQFIPVPSILKAEQGSKTLFSGDETEIILAFQDFPERADYYLYDFGQNIYRPIEDRFFQGEEFVFLISTPQMR